MASAYDDSRIEPAGDAAAADDDYAAETEEGAADESFFQRRRSSKPGKPIDAVVSLLDGRELSFVCSNGKYTTAEELADRTASKLGLSRDSRPLFAIWIVSGSLQLQMKPHHLPFKVMRKWSELLESFSTSDPFSEVPLIYYKREATVHQGLEQKCRDPVAIELFFHEMTFNVIYSLYPCKPEEAAYLAAIHLRMEKGPKASKSDMGDVLGCSMPEHFEKNIKLKKWEKMVLDEMSKISIPAADKHALHLLYLQFGRQWPYYGAVFFFGEMEPPESRTVMQDRLNEVVRVGVNLEGVHVISDKKNVVTLSMDYDELTYNSYEDPESGDCCFLVEYNHDDVEETKDQLVVWTLQAQMIDTLVTRYIDLLKDWQAHLSERRVKRGRSIKPSIQARGRANDEQGGLLERFQRMLGKDTDEHEEANSSFTLSRFRFRSSKREGSSAAAGAAGSSFDDIERQEIAEHPL